MACAIGFLAWLTLACALSLGQSGEDSLRARARELSQRFIIVDTHIDLPMNLYEKWHDISIRSNQGDFDYERAREGGLDVAFTALYTGLLEGSGKAKAVADSELSVVRRVVATWPEKFALATSVADVQRLSLKGKVVLALGIENGSALEGDLANLRHFYDEGVRYITLTHGKCNLIGDASYDTTRRWNGLSPYGREVVSEMNRLGIMVDISHVSDSTFYDVLRVSRAPVIASHSSCRYFTPGFERNMSDDMIRLLAARGGVVQINFGSEFLRPEILAREQERQRDLSASFLKAKVKPDGKEAEEIRRAYRSDHPPVYASVSDVAAHIDHVAGLVGVDHVGLGSDFDGVGDSLPAGLKDVSYYPELILELLKMGYTEGDIRKICSGNILRVWSEVERIAREGGVR